MSDQACIVSRIAQSHASEWRIKVAIASNQLR
jgi:hypothetical protein